jgi:hypothetical protein
LHKDEEILILLFVEKHNAKTGQNAKVFLDFWLKSAIIISVRGVKKDPTKRKGDKKNEDFLRAHPR